MAHVYAADQGLQLQNETVESIFYDDAAMLLLVIKGGVVFAYDLAVDVPAQHEQLVWTYPLQEGPPVLRARCSLDRQLLALQRSPLLLELVDLLTGNISVMASDKGRHELLGMFFSEQPDAQLVLVSRGGLELCTWAARRQGVHSRERLRLPVHWYQYSHETRCCLVATGPPLGPPYMQAWQFLVSGMVTLPPFTLASSATGTALNTQPHGTPSPAPYHQRGNSGSSRPAQPLVPGLSAQQGQNEAMPASFPTLPISTHASGGEDAPRPPAPHSRTASGSSGAAGHGQGTTPAAAGRERGQADSGPKTAAPAEAAWKAMKQPVSSLLSWMGGGGGGVAADVLGSAGIVQSVLPSWSTPLTSVSAVLAAETIPPAASVRLVKMYGRVYCVHVVAAQRRLDLYRLFTDTVALQHSYRLPDAAVTPGPSPFLLGTTDAFDGHGALTLSVVDNVLVLHLPHDGSALLFDVCADATSPVSEPQPLGHLAPLRRTRQLQEERMQLQLARQMRAAVATGNALRGGAPEPAVSGQAAAPPPLPQPTAWSVMDGGEAAQGLLLDRRHTQFHLPNLIVDSKSQVVYRLLLDLHAISKGAPSQATLAAFLQRRRAPRLHVQPVELTLGLGLPGFVLPPSPLPSANLRPPATSAPVGSLSPSPEPPSMLAERMGLQGGACSQHQPADGFSPRTPEQLKAAVSGFGVDKAAEGSASSDPGVMMAGLRHTSLGSGYGSGSPLVAPHPVMLSGVVSVGATTCKLLLLQHVQGLMQDEVPLAELRSVLDAMSKAYSELALAAASGRTTLAASACVVSPSDLVVHILAAMCVRADLPPARHRYLQAVLAELTASVATAGVRPPAALQLLGLQMVWPPCSGPAPLPPVPSPTISLTPHPASGTRHVAALGAAPAAWLQAAADGAQRDLAADAASGQPQPAQIPAAGGGSMQQGPQQLHAEVLARVLHCSLEHLSPEAQPAQIQALGADCAARGSMGAGALAVGSSARTEESTIQLRHCAVGEAAAVEAGMALLAVRARAAAGAQQNTATAAGLAVDKAGRGGSATSKPNAQSPGNFVPVRPHGQAADTAQPTSGVPEPTSDGVQGAAPAVPGAVPAPGPTPAASTPAPNQQPLAGGDGTPTGHAAASVAPATGGPQAASAAAAAGSSEPGVALVMQLLAQGRVVKAARVARELHVSQLPPSQLLLAAAQAAQPTSGHASQAGVFAAVYRSFRPALMPLHPTLEAARQAMLSV